MIHTCVCVHMSPCAWSSTFDDDPLAMVLLSLQQWWGGTLQSPGQVWPVRSSVSAVSCTLRCAPHHRVSVGLFMLQGQS